MSIQSQMQLNRRRFLAACAAAMATTVPTTHDSTALASNSETRGNRSQNAALANPMIGTGWHGHTFPGATAPFGLLQLSPDTAGPPEVKWHDWYDLYGWDHCSGYHYSDNTILGFSHTHLSGTGATDLGDVLLMPMVQGRNWGWNAGVPGKEHQAQIAALGPDSGWASRDDKNAYSSRFSHAAETARPGFYQVTLETSGVKAELTATTRCGMHRYHFPEVDDSTDTGVILDLVHGLGCKVYSARLNIESLTRISGWRFTHGWAANKQVYFVMEFSAPFARISLQRDGRVEEAHVGASYTDRYLKAIVHRQPESKPLIIKVGLSCTGVDGAKANLAREMPDWNFDRLVEGADAGWNTALSGIEAELIDQNLTRCFYSGLYHCMMAPATFNNVDGSYRGEDHKNHPNPGFTNYTTMSIWDIFRGEFPLLTIVAPDRINSIVNTLLLDYTQLNAGALPVWPLWGNETWAMGGFHSTAMIVGAYTRGFRGFNVPDAYAAMRETALVGSLFTGRNQNIFRRKGYVPSGPRVSAVSATLDLAYDYWCVGAMAELLGKHDDMQMFYRYGQNYRHLFDAKSGFMRGRLPNGTWRTPFKPNREYWSDYTESDAWQATFNVMQDVQGLIGLYGSDAAFIAKLDGLFTAHSFTANSPPDISAMVGQDAQGNEPSNHIPYLFCFAGAAWKTQFWVRKMLGLYRNSPAGIPGNDDCGQTSSCFVLGALGFYSVNPATGVYVIGSPLMRRATIHNRRQRTQFIITAAHNSHKNVYIQKATLNGQPLTRSWITHAEITAGGRLEFVMGPTPNRAWASAKADRPPSGVLMNRG